MGVTEFFQMAGQFGAMGLLVGYLVWRENCDRRDRRESLTTRAEIDEKDIASREKLASALTALSLAITGRPHV